MLSENSKSAIEWGGFFGKKHGTTLLLNKCCIISFEKRKKIIIKIKELVGLSAELYAK